MVSKIPSPEPPDHLVIEPQFSTPKTPTRASLEGRAGMKGKQRKEGRTATAEAAAGPVAASANPPPPPFLSKTYDMVDDQATDAVISWGPENNTFVVWNTTELARDLLPKYFKHNNFSSFVRQLNTYGFKKVDPDKWEFANEGFLRGKRNLLKTISRRKSTNTQNQLQQPQTHSSTFGTIELGNFGLEEQIERLKRDKNVLKQELVRLRQHQQGTDNQVNTLGQRLQGMEQRQQQMMAFLAKAVKNPGFFAQLVQQNDSNRRITSVNKKRRLPKQEKNLDGKYTEQNGQIVKYQPLINEAAKAMLAQILKLDTSLGNSESLLIGNTTSPLSAFDSRSSLRRNSGVTLSEVPTSFDIPNFPADSGYSAISSSTPCRNPSLTSIANMADTDKMPITDNSVAKHSTLHIPPCIDNYVEAAGASSLTLDGGSIYFDPNPEFIDDLLGVETERFSSNTDMEILNNGEQLPSIIDPFWEQFLASSMLLGDTEKVDSSTHENGETMEEIGNGWESSNNMDYLSEQMENLASNSIM